MNYGMYQHGGTEGISSSEVKFKIMVTVAGSFKLDYGVMQISIPFDSVYHFTNIRVLGICIFSIYMFSIFPPVCPVITCWHFSRLILSLS